MLIDADSVPVKQLFEKNYHQGKAQLTHLSKKLKLITGVLALNGGASAASTDEMTVSGLVETLQALVKQAEEERAVQVLVDQVEAEERAVCIITGLGKVTRELQ